LSSCSSPAAGRFAAALRLVSTISHQRRRRRENTEREKEAKGKTKGSREEYKTEGFVGLVAVVMQLAGEEEEEEAE
jgi:hypothetical protein